MSKRHKHADVIIAWAEGKDVQVWSPVNNRWETIEKRTPDFLEGNTYRIKPPTKKYRVALFEDDSGSYTFAANTQDYADTLEPREDFIRWLTDWIEYEE